MEDSTIDVIDRVRQLMPLRTLDILARPLTEAEARVVAERQANSLVRLLGITKPSVEIELIAEFPNIQVEVVTNLPMSGTSQWVNGRWLVRINADDSLWRCRSTLAHELKHILDDPFREVLYPDWPRGFRGAPPSQVERLSEYFAGCVLVPKAWLHQAWRSDVRSVTELASLFDVSEALISVRLRQTGLLGTRKSSMRWPRYTRRAYRRSAAAIHSAASRLPEVHGANGVALHGGCPL